ncbi:Tho complex subunit 7/Mft1p [Ophiocordyceps camponoti-floridani]|uniref:Tho complex subunit 7/Mft1p n=1 Tax=Ophiocordyceps camponoti-floridani TaxID=2030778 RepID=A0A8H4VG53_9HYPO|nr:Tho complex subunit 7/Mft1p [Ophiocordyceps camponoti-floridani]
MASWGLLDDRSESDLHKTRLLNVEEKPLKRITKRLAAISSAVSRANGALEPEPSEKNGDFESSESLLIDVTHDFAALDSSIARFQFLHDASRRERERYATDQQRILAECQAVRENNGRLRGQLEAARATLAQRQKFDELAERITSNRLLRPRDDQRVNLAKLEDECRELERESEAYGVTWRERRHQFNRIMEEGMMLRRLIRDEKEEVDRREGMNEDGDDDAVDADKDISSQTPRMNEATPQADMDGNNQSKPLGTTASSTPALTVTAPVATRRIEASETDTPARSDQAVEDAPPREDVEMEDGEERPPAGTDDERDDRGTGTRGVESTEEENMVVDE